MTLEFQSVSDSFKLAGIKGQELYFQTPELEQLFSMVGELSTFRVEVEDAIKALKQAQEPKS
jgi:hypothetical protein